MKLAYPLLLLAVFTSGQLQAAAIFDGTRPVDRQMDDGQISRLLTQATFGPTREAVQQVGQIGYRVWLQRQRHMPPTLHLPEMLASGEHDDIERRMEIWWECAIWGEDQLRQRVAFALSEILVASEFGSQLGEHAFASAYYYDILVQNALGNYRDLIEEITLSPGMGIYLSMLGNQKPDPAAGIRADENYAREIMQLFTIGLVQLNPDGTARLDTSDQTIPTYSQSDIENLARLFTGWTTAGTIDWYNPAYTPFFPMAAFEAFHDRDAKTIVGGVLIPAGTSAEDELEIALDTLFNHDNVAPFIGKQLIQRLVTSNPTADYVARISNVFNDNGDGVRGDLGAVVVSILTDPEAIYGNPVDGSRTGKLREPLLRVTHLWRALGAEAGNGTFSFLYPSFYFGQGALRSPSVFNFYRPSYAPPGELTNSGLVAPEFQIATENYLINTSTFLLYALHYSFKGIDAHTEVPTEQILVDLSYESALAQSPPRLVAHLDQLFMAGAMSDVMRATLLQHISALPFQIDGLPSGLVRALDAVWLTISSSEYAIQR